MHCRMLWANSTANSVETRMSSAMRPSGLSTSSASRPSWYWRPGMQPALDGGARQPGPPVDLQAALDVELDGDADAGRDDDRGQDPQQVEQQVEVALLERVEEVAVPEVEPERDADVGAAPAATMPPVSSQATDGSPALSSSRTQRRRRPVSELCGVSKSVAEARVDAVELPQQRRPVEQAERPARLVAGSSCRSPRPRRPGLRSAWCCTTSPRSASCRRARGDASR